MRMSKGARSRIQFDESRIWAHKRKKIIILNGLHGRRFSHYKYSEHKGNAKKNIFDESG